MKIAAGTISYYGYGKPQCNSMLLGLYKVTVQKCAAKGVDLVCLPGGFLRARDEDDLQRLASRITREAKQHGVSIAVGIDLSKKDLSKSYERLIRGYQLPWFAVCWSPQSGRRKTWRQRSRTREDYRLAR